MEAEVLITVQGNGWKDLFKCRMKSGAYSDTPFLVVTAANCLCSIGSNRIVLPQLPRASMLKKQEDRSAGLAQPMKIIISYLKMMINIVKSKIIIILQYNYALVKSKIIIILQYYSIIMPL